MKKDKAFSTFYNLIRPVRILWVFLWVCFVIHGQEKGIACLGNGEMCVYEDKADIIQLFGPPYSSPSVFELRSGDRPEVVSEREKGTAVWTHTFRSDGEEKARITDFVATTMPAFIRIIRNSETLSFTLKLSQKTEWLDQTPVYDVGSNGSASRTRTDQTTGDGSQVAGAFLLTTPAGSYAYQDIFYPTSVANHYLLIISGDMELSGGDDQTHAIRCLPGESRIMVVGGKDFPACVVNTEKAFMQGHDSLLADTRKDWATFTSSRIDFEKEIPSNTPERERLLKAIDDVAVLIKTQQGKEGGVLAGYNYHLAYVRDQYGVSKGLLKLGHVTEAKAILQFYWNVWQRKGRLHNAQGIGLDAFHVHENDEVEITGYLIIQAFDLLKATGDNTFIKEIFPMLQWAWDCQVRNLYRQMLPFNGDETYIAGGILPRTVMFDGSAEATLLFATGGKQLITWAEKNNAWNRSTLNKNSQILQEVISGYARNFLRDGKLLTNNPDRKQGLERPPFRHGVCESCYRLGWTQKTANDRYLCPHCFPVKTLPDITDEHFFLQSVSLMPWYVQSDLIPDNLISAMIEEIVRLYTSTGKFPSRPDGTRTVGYDYGLFLYSLTKMNHPLKEKIYRQMLHVVDAAGAWTEYYEDNIPSGTLCRPWESAINIEAAIEYARQSSP